MLAKNVDNETDTEKVTAGDLLLGVGGLLPLTCVVTSRSHRFVTCNTKKGGDCRIVAEDEEPKADQSMRVMWHCKLCDQTHNQGHKAL